MALNTTITAGDLKDKVVLKKPVQSTNVEGGITTTYPANTLTVFGCVRSIDQRRVMEAGTDALIDAKELFIRDASNRQEITKDWLVVHNGMEYIIQSKEQVQNRFFFLRFVIKSKGTGATVPVIDEGETGAVDPTGPELTLTVTGAGNFQFAANQKVTVDFGDGSPVQLVTSAQHVYPEGEHTMKVYHHNEPTIIAIASNFVQVLSVTGVQPTGLQQLTIAAKLTEVPVLAPMVKNLALRNNWLEADDMDAIIAELVDNGQEDGTLDLSFNLGNVPTDTAGIAVLEGRGWTVTTS